ncbi:type II toxin-antitoxin system RelE/ParE family toxin [Oleiharenicola lentus]|jgi:plasmid stabilization system protein ParE|uniref:Type II toxin-antitoxin system RelE/ParE family toxin n=1 Tax=Oleiharenicola lentus TaxID=2508720 RepID=A0A4Q1C943_9BACT|nr:type II toxin-antitoxin system RelE/ParE family toxin [Oleiharenicola lentus]RXK55517.1 type II toxin-antitoxin system RelE/ParE family toxin [Oleiharenicola lentus]
MRIVLHPEADREFAEAALYYETKRPGLGADFILAVDEAVADLRDFPYRWRIIEDGVRRGLIRRFPYAFYYWEKLAGEELEILSISHSKRHPLHWLGRYV